MMSKIDDNLNQILNVDYDPRSENKVTVVEPEVMQITSGNDTQNDYDLTRKTIKSLMEKGQEALNDLLFVAKQSEEPRAYEVVAAMIKNISDVTKELIDLQKKMKSLSEDGDEKSSGGLNVKNALFVGSTAELQKLLRQTKEQDDEENK